MVIYVDILLFINAVVNYAVLMTAEKLLKRSCRLYRILIGAFIGSLFSLLIFWKGENRFFLFLLKSVSTAIITLIAFGWKSRLEYMKAGILTLTVSVVYSGFFILFYQICRPPNMVIVNDIVYFQVNPLWLIALTAFIYFILLILYKLFSERIKSTVVSLSFTVDDHTYNCIGKIDTGCNLREPFSSAPVIIADRTVFIADDRKPYRIIPYSAIGGSSFLKAVKAQSVIINKQPVEKEIYIASSEISSNSFQAIINSDITR